MMLRAFFSYSHADQELVQTVLSKVGRPHVHIDTVSFKTGGDLIESMEGAIRESGVFVLFVSRASLASPWVDFEVTEARYQHAVKRIRRVLVVILDSRIGPADLPQWLTKTKFVQSGAAGPIARIVREAIDEASHDEASSIFVGRARETFELQGALVPADISGEPALVWIKGLPGSGRRTLLSRVLSSSMALTRILTIRIEPGDSAISIAIKVADLIEKIGSPLDALRVAKEIEKLQVGVAVERTLENLASAQKHSELVVLYDDGGLLDDRGAVSEQVRPLIEAILNQTALTTAIIANRHPVGDAVSGLQDCPIVSIGHLTSPEVRQLLALLAKRENVSLAAGEIAALVEQVRGYPPGAQAAIRLVKTYGAALAVGIVPQGNGYQPRPLFRYLRSLSLSKVERRILSLLARNSPLPLDVIVEIAARDGDAVSALTSLIDASLVVPQLGTSWYHISEPIVDYVDREYPALAADDYRTVAMRLDKFLDQATGDDSYVDLSRVLYRANIRSGAGGSSRAYALAADWLRLCASFYHDRDYESCVKHARLVLEYAKAQEDALAWLIKSLVKLGDHQEASELIDVMRTSGNIREANFLLGFSQRHRGQHGEAIKSYERAVAAGRGGLAVLRDLADCYYHLGKLIEANLWLEKAQAKQPDNRYVVTLKIKIACKTGDETEARRLLDILEQVDTPVFFEHRRARVELAFGKSDEAYAAAASAASASSRPPREVLATLALCEVKTGRLADAGATIDRLEATYRRPGAQVHGLRARLAMAEDRFEDALGHIALLPNPNDPIHLALRRDALLGLLEKTSVPATVREEYDSEVERIESLLPPEAGVYDWFADEDAV